MLTLYENIKNRREELGLTKVEVANRIGYERSMITKVEQGKVDLTQSKIAAFAEALETTPAYLMGWTDDPMDYDNIDDMWVPDEYKKLGMGVKEYMAFKKAEEEDALKEQSLYADTYTEHEQNVIQAYRNQPEMQPAVDKILGIGKKEKSERLESVSLEDDSEYIELVARGGKYKVKKADVVAWVNQLDLDDYEEDHDLC